MALALVRQPFPDPEAVTLRTDYRVGALTYGALDLAKRQADLICGEVVKVTTRESQSVVYRAEAVKP